MVLDNPLAGLVQLNHPPVLLFLTEELSVLLLVRRMVVLVVVPALVVNVELVVFPVVE